MLSSATISLDTSVLIEYIDESGDFHQEATIVVNGVFSGKAAALIPHIVFAELYYVSSKLYEKEVLKHGEGVEDENSNEFQLSQTRTEKLVNWLYKSPNISVPQNSIELALEVGMIKKKFAFALTDCYVLAIGKLNGCKTIFKSVEDEMKRGDKLARLKKEEKIGILFLEDYS